MGVFLTLLHVCTAIPSLNLDSHFIRQLDLAAYDWMIKNNASVQKSDAVAIVDIDEESLSKLGQWPRHQAGYASFERLGIEARAIAPV